jgi:predicted dinucleotide-utilizing enzyme
MNPRIAIIGFGTIASELVRQLQLRPATAVNLAGVLRPGSPRAGSVPRDVSTLTTIEALQKFAPDLVVEAA